MYCGGGGVKNMEVLTQSTLVKIYGDKLRIYTS